MNWQNILANPGTAEWILLTIFYSLGLSIIGFLTLHSRWLRVPTSKATWCVFVILLLITLFIQAPPSRAKTEWVNIYGTVTYDDNPVCAMVLANGQYMFTGGDNLGVWDLEVPLDSSGLITLYGFCSGLSPFKTKLTPSEAMGYDISMIRAADDSRELDIIIRIEPGNSNPNWVRLGGTVTHDGTPVCAMVLANGQAMFSCPPDNFGVFDLEVPLDENGDITLLVFASGLAPYKEIFLDADQEFYKSSGITLSSLTETQVEHLAKLCMVWGFLKYHHPRITAGELPWDFELFRVLPKVLYASDLVNLQDVLTEWVAKLGVPQGCNPCAEEPENTHLLPEIDWIRDVDLLGAELSDQLQTIHANRFSGDEQFYVAKAPNVGNPLFDQELAYESQELPDAGFRILALFRLWNIIEYWFPNRDLLDDDWGSVLEEFLPSFVETESWDGYKLELLRFIARFRDTHANLWQAFNVRPPQGTCYWPVEIRFIEGRPTIVAFTDSALGAASGLEIGDIIETVDGRSIDSLIEEWSPYYCASNATTRLRDIARYLPRGDCGESILTIDRDGQPLTFVVTRTPGLGPSYLPHDRPGETFQLLSPEIAYIKLSSIQAQDVTSYIAIAYGTRGLVIDIRNYPNEFVVFELGGHLVDQPTPFARFTEGDLDNPGAFTWTTAVVLYPYTPIYKGKIAILVDEMSISQAEYTAMAFRAGPRAVVVGSTTAGADGNVSQIPIPGGLSTLISGIGVFYPDKTPTQRVGIIPDIVATPTRDGIRSSRDEVLEAALSHILDTPVDEEIQNMAKPE